MNLQEAQTLANRIHADLARFCERIEIAGSVRRRKPDDIKDVEIVCIPKTQPITDMFGMETGTFSLLESALPDLYRIWNAWTIKAGEKYKQILFPGGGKLDLFIVTPETWGYQFAIRTGPADYSHWLVTPRRYGGGLPSYLTVKDARLWNGSKPLNTSEEEYFFDNLDIDPYRHRGTAKRRRTSNPIPKSKGAT